MKILLEGAEAHEYMELRDKYDNLAIELSALKAENAMLNIIETIDKAKADMMPSTKIKDDVQKAKDTQLTPSFAKVKPRVLKVSEELKTGRWEQYEIKIIDYAMSRPSNEGNRKLAEVVKKLGRGDKSVREKLRGMGINVQDGILYKA